MFRNSKISDISLEYQHIKLIGEVYRHFNSKGWNQKREKNISKKALNNK